MKRNTPLITLLVGAALGVVLLVASMLTTPSSALPNYSAAAASSAAPASAAAPAESSEAPEPAESSAAASAPAAAPSPAPTRTTPTADFTGRVGGGGGSVAVAVHGDKAIAYVCNGSTVEGWMKGKVENGKLVAFRTRLALSFKYEH